jgi:hypothetical protein
LISSLNGENGAGLPTAAYKHLQKTKWLTLVGSTLTVASSTVFYIEALLFVTIGRKIHVFWRSPWLHINVFGANADSILNDIGICLASGMVRNIFSKPFAKFSVVIAWLSSQLKIQKRGHKVAAGQAESGAKNGVSHSGKRNTEGQKRSPEGGSKEDSEACSNWEEDGMLSSTTPSEGGSVQNAETQNVESSKDDLEERADPSLVRSDATGNKPVTPFNSLADDKSTQGP